MPRIGILGGGQLGRMMGSAALQLGLPVAIYQSEDAGPASWAAQVMTGAWDDRAKLAAFLQACDVVTLDNEWVPLDPLRALLPDHVRLWPSPQTMELVRDKVHQKDHARAAGLPLGDYRECRSLDALRSAAEDFGYPLMLKRPCRSYDGYGNRTVHGPADLAPAWEALAGDGRLLAERFVPFARELSVIVARRPSGEDLAYPVALTIQRDHRCEAVEVPARISPDRQDAASRLARQAAAAYGCVGVVGVELFELASGELLLNEIAPRPHNSGHYTIDACVTSQFENHLRAVLDLPLGDPSLRQPAAVMVNVIGHRDGPVSSAALASALAVPGAAVHVYGKHQVRRGRKMGHVTVVGDDLDSARARAYDAARRLEL